MSCLEEVCDSDAGDLCNADVITETELDALPLVENLGEGSFGCVDRVIYKGRDAIRKKMKGTFGDFDTFLWECRVMMEVDGAGGSPRLHAICGNPCAVIQDYAGLPYYEWYFQEHVTIEMFLQTVVGVAESLAEVHQRGFIHNDIKNDNITVSGPPQRPKVHVIDFGLASRVGQPFNFEFFGMDPAVAECMFFRSPELRKGDPLRGSSDVYSVGVMLAAVSSHMNNPFLDKYVLPIANLCVCDDPAARLTLDAIARIFTRMS